MLITKKPKRKIIKEIIEEILQAIEDSFVTIAKDDYISYILYIGRADVIPELKAHFGTSCVIDYQLDRYYDETQELFYLHYLNRNYSKEGFKYDGWVCISQSIQKLSNTFQCWQNWKGFDAMIAHKIYHWDSKESNPSPLI